MTQINSIEPRAATEHKAVRVVDCDVHPTPRRGALLEFMPDEFRKVFASRLAGAGSTAYYDAPDYAHAQAMRVDTFPDDGEFAGSDPDMTFRQLIMDSGSDIAILGPLNSSLGQTPEEFHALAVATNRWQDACWLDGENNWHKRYYGSITAAMDAPELAAREIDEWAGHPHMAQVLIHAEMRPAWGSPMYDPVWAAATRNNLPVACHLGRRKHDQLPMSPVGFLTYNHDFMVTISLLAANQVMSLIFDGVFDRFPTLQIVFIEFAFNWILPLMWRMDAIHAALGSETGLKRKPSEYVRDHMWFTTQPLDYPEDKLELSNVLEWMEADKILLFSSDYPHWTFDEPRWLVKHIPARMRDQVMFGNGLQLFDLPNTVPALPGQVSAY